VWPSLVALLGTVAVVGGLLLFFGRDVGGSGTVTAASTDPAVAGEGTPAPTESATPEPPVDVKAPVVVLNGSSSRGLAARTGEALTAAGWTVAATDNYNGDLAATTIFYPAELQAAAETLRRAFPTLATLAPSEPGMSTDQLTLVMAGDVDLGG
jgi:hypothetical protein